MGLRSLLVIRDERRLAIFDINCPYLRCFAVRLEAVRGHSVQSQGSFRIGHRRRTARSRKKNPWSISPPIGFTGYDTYSGVNLSALMVISASWPVDAVLVGVSGLECLSKLGTSGTKE